MENNRWLMRFFLENRGGIMHIHFCSLTNI
nr:MAG TPA: hypothetical protein [Caudoviricetes sp.]